MRAVMFDIEGFAILNNQTDNNHVSVSGLSRIGTNIYTWA
tara:strand:+ start:283 stop:402 length:120 start_codon:yes stop_codon:yes gene_type:complete